MRNIRQVDLKDTLLTTNWRPLHHLRRKYARENGIRRASKGTSNSHVKAFNVVKKCEPIVYVMLGSGCVNLAL